MRTTTTSLVALAVALGVTAACGAAPDTAGPGSSGGCDGRIEGPLTVRISTHAVDDPTRNPNPIAVYKDVIDRFNATVGKEQGVTAEVVSFSENAYEKQLTAAIQAGNMLATFLVAPLAYAVAISFTNRVAVPSRRLPTEFVGAANYGSLLTDADFLTAVLHNVAFTAIVVPLQTALALGMIASSSPRLQPLPLGMLNYVGTTPNWGGFSAYATLMVAPVVVVFLMFQKAFVQGVAASGMKG
jgi:ABC-type maltose transport system permease subunit